MGIASIPSSKQTKYKIIRVTYKIRKIYTKKNYISQLQTKWIKILACRNRTEPNQRIVIIITVINRQKVCICLGSFNNLYGFLLSIALKVFICKNKNLYSKISVWIEVKKSNWMVFAAIWYIFNLFELIPTLKWSHLCIFFHIYDFFSPFYGH